MEAEFCFLVFCSISIVGGDAASCSSYSKDEHGQNEHGQNEYGWYVKKKTNINFFRICINILWAVINFFRTDFPFF